MSASVGAALVQKITRHPALGGLRTLPDFLIIGAQKSGTSSLYSYLSAHPRVVPAAKKEIHFFDNKWERGTRWYRTQFPYAARLRGGKVTGEATPYLLFDVSAPARVRQVVPDARLVVLLRDPVERAYSHYWHERDRGTETLSFEEALAAETERTGADTRPGQHNYSYVARGEYVVQLERWFEHFPREQLYVDSAERLFESPQTVTNDVLAWLGLPSLSLGSWPVERPGRKPTAIEPETEQRLRAHFAPYNVRLYDLLGTDFGWRI